MAIDGDTLRICSNGPRGDDRPDDFTTKADDGRLLMVYRRISHHAMTTENLKAIYPGDPTGPPGMSAMPGSPAMSVPGGAKPATDEDRIQGIWKVVSSSNDGTNNPQTPPFLTMTFRGNETFTSGSDKPNLFQLDNKHAPAHLTIAGHNMYMQAIYKLDKDKLIVAFFGKPETGRPRSFKASDAGGDGLPLIVWELERAVAK